MTRAQPVHAPEDGLTCECGNTRQHEGFYECNAEGWPAHNGDGLICCERCGKIIEQSTGEYVGHRNFAVRETSDERS